MAKQGVQARHMLSDLVAEVIRGETAWTLKAESRCALCK
jgi:hypothetical protein